MTLVGLLFCPSKLVSRGRYQSPFSSRREKLNLVQRSDDRPHESQGESKDPNE